MTEHCVEEGTPEGFRVHEGFRALAALSPQMIYYGLVGN